MMELGARPTDTDVLMDRTQEVLANVKGLARSFAEDKSVRARRTAVERADFDRLRDAGYLLTGVPVECGGLWVDARASSRAYCEMVRALGAADPSLALVCTMHPAVLVFWLDHSTPQREHAAAWRDQREWIFQTALDGSWWGTIASEPGSGGDLTASKATAHKVNTRARDAEEAYRIGVPVDLRYQLTGDKHMGSGSGITDFMITVARPDAEEQPELFFLDVRNSVWDGSTGMKLVREWDGYGMGATQSHAFRFDAYPIERYAWPTHALEIVPNVMPLILCLFSSAVMGVLDGAMELARTILTRSGSNHRPIERVAWVNAENQYWLAEQAWRGAMAALSEDRDPAIAAARAKYVLAELAESMLSELAKALGAKSFSQSLPFGQWMHDVRALGFLRPPWGLATDQLYDMGLLGAESA